MTITDNDAINIPIPIEAHSSAQSLRLNNLIRKKRLKFI